MVELTRRWVLAGLLSGAAAPALAQIETSPLPKRRPEGPPEPLDLIAASEEIITAAGLSGQVCYILADAETGQVLASRAPEQKLPPASVAKTITALYALDTLGPGYRYSTRLIGTGPIRDGILQGDLILEGGGAPDLSSDDLASLVEQAREAGLVGVTGAFRVWAGALPYIRSIDPDQPEHLGYSPSISGMNLNFNRVHFEWRRQGSGYGLTMDARTGAVAPKVERIEIDMADRSLPLFTFAEDAESRRESWSVAKAALGNGGSRDLPVRNSDLFASEVLRTLARDAGLVLPPVEAAESRTEGQVIGQQFSPPLAEIINGMLLYSTNLTAEVIGLTASAQRLGVLPKTLAESAAEMTRWAESALGLSDIHMVDHSGLEDGSRISPQDILAALSVAGPESQFHRLLRRFLLMDDAGQPERMEVRAKTGTLNFVSALAGFITPDQGRRVAFAIQTADLERRAKIAPGDEESPAGQSVWVARSRKMQFDLVRLWGYHA
jgi:D-alanyl-D-alanine carboxypeptidase/D-alanyl-D-alanine-endopeptidase (penicillin-binding protein 4)